MDAVKQLFAGVFEIAALVVSLAVLATLVRNASGTAQVISASAGGFAEVLNAATQGSGGFSSH